MLRWKLCIYWDVGASGVIPGLSQLRHSPIAPVLNLRKREDGSCWCEAHQWPMTACPAPMINRVVLHMRYSLGIQEIWVQLSALLWIPWSLASLVCNSPSLPCHVSCVTECTDFKEERNSSGKRGCQISMPLGTKKHLWYNSADTELSVN